MNGYITINIKAIVFDEMSKMLAHIKFINITDDKSEENINESITHSIRYRRWRSSWFCSCTAR
ncbi:hypothetical protein BN1326_90073 [Staphylococcus argenteus]|uniref:Uncharacterized protein n=1 Tax=Staphylococcus argenteus TaxID=985002 RepID=A0A7U7PZ19_9STAP|nr:hypothetical protein BN1326_90073 [Staphylococcus argenteus]CRI29408.1 hypothetical protein BN1326_90073 [Staphylococcus argenteus]